MRTGQQSFDQDCTKSTESKDTKLLEFLIVTLADAISNRNAKRTILAQFTNRHAIIIGLFSKRL